MSKLDPLLKEMILDEMNKGIVVVDTDLNIVYINRLTEGILGLCRNQVIGHHVDKIFQEAMDYQSVLPDAVKSGKSKEIDSYKFGDKYLHVRAEPLKIEDKIVGGVSFIVDITEQMANRSYLEKMVATMAVHIIPVYGEIGVLPLRPIPFDTDGMNVEKDAMEQCQVLGITTLIVDLTAIPYADTKGIANFKKTTAGLQLIGVETVLTGISPKLAMQIVSSGIDLSHRKVFTNLKTAMNYYNV